MHDFELTAWVIAFVIVCFQTLAAGSPLDTVGSPSPPVPGSLSHPHHEYASDEHELERQRLAEGLGHFLTLQPATTQIDSEAASAAAAAAAAGISSDAPPIKVRRGSGSSTKSTGSNKPTQPPVVAAVTAAAKKRSTQQ
jgi:hypothetical protein